MPLIFSVIIPSVKMLSVIMPNVNILSVIVLTKAIKPVMLSVVS
jgi:hypothetical protein